MPLFVYHLVAWYFLYILFFLSFLGVLLQQVRCQLLLNFVLQEVRFVDLDKDSIAALEEAVGLHKQAYACSLSFLGKPEHCAAAMQDMGSKIEVNRLPRCCSTCNI